MALSAPVVILVRPQMGENIGAAARAMSNFGLRELRLVAPRDGWPNSRALEMASGGVNISSATATVYDTHFPAAVLADIQLAYATTARSRDMEKRVVDPKSAAMEEIGHSATAWLMRKVTTALIFGPERTGLENDDVSLCDTLITIPTAPENSSLNLGAVGGDSGL